MAARSAVAAAVACALLATAQAQTGIQRSTIIHECFYGGQTKNILRGAKAGGKCMATAQFSREYYSLRGQGSCIGFRDCAGYVKNAFKLQGVSGKRIKIWKLGLCGEIDQGAGSVGFAFRGNKGTKPWGITAGQASYPFGKLDGQYGSYNRYDMSTDVRAWNSNCAGCDKQKFAGFNFRLGATASGSNTKMEATTADIMAEGGGMKNGKGQQEIFFTFKDGESVEIDAMGNRDPDNRFCKTVITRPNGNTLSITDTLKGKPVAEGNHRPIIDYEYQCTPKAAATDVTCPRCEDNCKAKDGKFTATVCQYTIDAGYLVVAKQAVCGSCGPECGGDTYEAIPCGNDKVDINGIIPGGNKRQCAALTKCQEGYTFEIKKGGGKSDRLCAPVTRCVLGYEIETAKPTATSDRKCMAVTACGLDEFETKPANATTNPECQKAKVCSEGEFESKALSKKADRDCTTLKSCSAAQYESKAPTATEDRTCNDLTPECKTSSGFATITEATKTSDRLCAECKAPAEFLDAETGKCTPASTCGMVAQREGGELQRPWAYTRKSPATATKDAVCEPVPYTCHSGTFNPSEENQTPSDCYECKECKVSEVMVSACTATSDRVCEPTHTQGAQNEVRDADQEPVPATEPKIMGVKGNLVVDRPLFVQGSEMAVAQRLANLKAQQAEVARLNSDIAAIAMHVSEEL